MEDKIIIELFKQEFEYIKCSKEYYNSLTDEEKKDIIIDMFYNAAENIDEDNMELRETEIDEKRWYNKYYDSIINIYKKYMEKE